MLFAPGCYDSTMVMVDAIQVTLHVALVHSFVNPSLFIVLHRGIRQVDQIDFIGPKSDHCLTLPCQSVTKVSFCSY